MRVLALDTSSLSLSCALVELGPPLRVIAEKVIDPPARHGDVLPGALLELGPLDDVSGIAVGLGPGSFTGLRVGLASAKALAYARKWPIAGASSLRALALAGPQGRVLVPTTEARRSELYAEVLSPDGGEMRTEAAYRAGAFQALIESLHGEGPLAVFGPGALACRGELPGVDVLAEPRVPPAWAVAQLCAAQLQGARYDQGALFALQPNYVKPSEAEVALAEGRVGGLPRDKKP